MTSEEISATLDAARHDIKVVDSHVLCMVGLIRNRLRPATRNHMSWSDRAALADLKRELRDFDSRTGRWK